MLNLRVKLYDLLLCLSHALELISPKLHNHHQQVAYLSYIIAINAGIPYEKRRNLFYAALIHDIGALTKHEKLDLTETENLSITHHGFRGAKLINGFKPLSKAGHIIKYHHLPWNNGLGLYHSYDKVSLESHIIHLADRICMAFDTQNDILPQVKDVISYAMSKSDNLFNPKFAEVLKSISNREYIWLDLFSRSPIERIPELPMYAEVLLMSDEVVEFTHLISQVIDFKSRFTACHSAGVAAIAGQISSHMYFSKSEAMMMQIAGNLHDLGKLAISNDILEKPGRLTYDEMVEIKKHPYYTYHLLSYIPQFTKIREWAAYHHERLNGKGYPFHIEGNYIPLGSRIMAVADIFTALSEDRPYRRGMGPEEVKKLLTTMVSNNEIDGNVVSVLLDNFDDISKVLIEVQSTTYNKFLEFEKSF